MSWGGSSSDLFPPKFKKFLKLGPGPPKWAPGPPRDQNGASEPPKSLKKHDSDLQNLEKTIAKLLKNGTVAGYARSALDNNVRFHTFQKIVNLGLDLGPSGFWILICLSQTKHLKKSQN